MRGENVIFWGMEIKCISAIEEKWLADNQKQTRHNRSGANACHSVQPKVKFERAVRSKAGNGKTNNTQKRSE